MENADTIMARRVARAACDFDQRLTGRVAQFVTAVLTDDTLVVSIHGVLSPSEHRRAASRSGAAEVREQHCRQLADSLGALRQHIKQAIGLDVCGATAEIEGASGLLVKTFTTSTGVALYLAAQVTRNARRPDLSCENLVETEA